MKRSLFPLLLGCGLWTAAAQQPRVTARVEPDSIFIGDRFEVVIEVEKDLV